MSLSSSHRNPIQLKGKIILIREQVPLSQLTTFQNDGVFPRVIDFESIAEVAAFMSDSDPESFHILGRGSNSLINPDASVQTVIRLNHDAVQEEINGSTVRLGAGMTMNRIQEFAVRHGLAGLEFAAGVPASLGGMVAMNFGCWGRSVSDFISAIQIVDQSGGVRWITPDDAQFGYRKSIFSRQKWMVCAAELRLEPADPDDVKLRMLARIRERAQKQPLKDKTFGSIFKNPEGAFAAQCIEAAGLKGKVWNRVEVSASHANFLVNRGGATYFETIEVLHDIQSIVQNDSGIQLEMEVKLLS